MKIENGRMYDVTDPKNPKEFYPGVNNLVVTPLTTPGPVLMNQKESAKIFKGKSQQVIDNSIQVWKGIFEKLGLRDMDLAGGVKQSKKWELFTSPSTGQTLIISP